MLLMIPGGCNILGADGDYDGDRRVAPNSRPTLYCSRTGVRHAVRTKEDGSI
jgi:hypothetical protein